MMLNSQGGSFCFYSSPVSHKPPCCNQMAKGKGAAGSVAVANRPAYSRVSFLFQAAALLAGTQQPTKSATTQASASTTTTTANEPENCVAAEAAETAQTAPLQGMARRLLTQMRSVSRKTNMRLRPAVKHRVCKYCDTLLVEGTTCVSLVENHSRGGRKPWADVLAVTCTTCGRARRYPVSAPRQPRRPAREGESKAVDPQEGEAEKIGKPKAQKQAKNGKQQHTVVVVGRGRGQRPTGGSAKNTPG